MSERKIKRQLNILDPAISPRTLIFSLVFPSFIEEFMQILTSYVDTAMVGRLSLDGSAAIAVNQPVLMLTGGFNFGLALGFSVMIARYIGEGHPEDAKEVIRNAMFHILWFGLFLTVLYIALIARKWAVWMNADQSIWALSADYMRDLGYSRMFFTMLSINSNLLRGQGDTRRPMFCNVMHNVVNVVMNYFLIYPTRTVQILGMSVLMPGADKGVAGAAIATSLSNVASGLLSMYFVLRKDNVIVMDRKKILGFNGLLLKRTYSLGLPIAMERLVISSGQIVTTRMLAGLGNAVVAGHSYANTAESVCYMPINGFGVAATTIVAQWLGAGDPSKAIQLGNKCIKYACIVMAVCAVLMFAFAPQLIGIFTTDEPTISMAAQALRVQAFAELFVAIANTVSGILRGAGDTKFSSVMSMAGMWGVRVPMAYMLIHYFGFALLGVWLPMALDWTIRCLLMTIRYKRGKWKSAWKMN